MQPSNPIELAVFNNLLGAIAEEMCAIVERTAYTTFVKETHDFGAGIATPDGVFFAYPRKSGVTSFLGLHLGDAIKAIPDWQPGDIVFTNDPFMSRRHASVDRDPTTGAFSVRDLGSSNGTFVAIREERELASGDHLRVGQHLFRLDVARGQV